jgi:uncharacterized protein YkwD
VSVSIGVTLIPIFLLGAAFSLGIIELAPQGGTIFVQNLENAKDEILDLAQGKTTVSKSFDKANSSVEEVTEESSKKLDNVIKYAQKKVNPSQSIVEADKPEFDAVKIENIVHELTNQERLNHGLSQLAIDPEITQIARGHSSDMAQREYFAHETPEGLSPSDRADQNGYSCQKIVGLKIYSGIAENIFQGHLFDSYYTINGEITSYEWNTEEEIAKITVDGWMNSPGHRENILTKIFDREGIGVEITPDHKVYVTQNFC